MLGWALPGAGASPIILPIGLSFHTFQSLSYVIEVYYRREKAEHNFITYATYVMFFPQLVAGPIERPQNLLHQFLERHDYDHARVTSGLKRMAWGFFKKLVVADRLALYVNDVYAAPSQFNGLQLTIATVFFAYQIYCDFSGYSDIAIGSARVLGFRLMENFRTPYWSPVDWRVLAQVAHLAVQLAPRLRVPQAELRVLAPSGWRAVVRHPRRCLGLFCRHPGHDAARRTVARSELDVRRVGWHARSVSGVRGTDEERQEEALPASRHP